MPLFFFDIQDGQLTADDVGSDFPDVHAARDAAIRVLPDIARHEMGLGESRQVAVLMRNEAGQAVFAASLIISTEWLIEAV